MMHQLKITPRLGISILFLLIALGFLLNAYLATYREQISVLEKERMGISFLRAATDVSNAFTDFRIQLFYYQAGEHEKEGDVAPIKLKVDEAMEALGVAYEEYGEALKLTQTHLESRGREKLSFAALHKLWLAISSVDRDKIDYKNIAELYRNFMLLSGHVVETSQLVIDSNSITYSLINAATNHVTEAINRLYSFDGQAYTNIVKNQPIPIANQLYIWDLGSFMKRDNIRLIGYNLENSIYYNFASDKEKELQANTLEAYQTYALTANHFADQLIAIGEKRDFDLEALTSEGLKTRVAVFDLWYKIMDQLAYHLDKRIIQKENELKHACYIALIASLLAIGFFVYMTRGIIKSLKSIEDAMDRIAKGELNTVVPFQEQRDEIGNMARTLERFRQSYWWLNDAD